MDSPIEVVTVGHAIVDVLAHVPDAVLEGFSLTKGTMTLVDDDRSQEVYAALSSTMEVSGGSAANTATGLASLGASAAFLGKVRDDRFGEVFAHDIRAAGVQFDVPAGAEGPATGSALVLVTEDAEKTMLTSLGIGDLLEPDDVDTEVVASARIVYIEGYLCGLPTTDPTVERIVAAAEAAGTLVSLSLSDPFWVQLHGDALDALLDRVDILFANEDEARGMTGADDVRAAVEALAKRCSTVVVTRGAAGSTVASDGSIVDVPATTVADVVDTTGAGDVFAAGYLYGFVRGFDPARSARLGGLAAAEVVSHLGARPLISLAELVPASE